MSKLEKLCRLAGVGGALAALVMLPVLLAGTAAHAQTDAFYVNYFANAQLGTQPPGTPNQDDIVRLIDTNVRQQADQNPLCAMVYVYDEWQEMQECCGCPVSAGGELALSVDGLTWLPTGDFVHIKSAGDPSLLFRGTIKIVSTNAIVTQLPPGLLNGPCAGDVAVLCDPTGELYPSSGAGSWTPVASLRGWTTHLQSYTTGYVTETRFEKTHEPDSDLPILGDACSSVTESSSVVAGITEVRGSCAAVCSAQGVNPYNPGGPAAPTYFVEAGPNSYCYSGL